MGLHPAGPWFDKALALSVPMKNWRSPKLLPAIALTVSAAALCQAEGTPKILSDVNLTGRFGYDTNLFGTDSERPGFPLAERIDRYWQTQLKVGANLPSDWVLGTKTSLSYQVTDTRYDRYRKSEDNTAHKVALTTVAEAGAWKGSFDGALTYVDGTDQSLKYLTYSSYGIALPRERREQLQTAVKAESKWTLGKTFARVQAAYTSFDLMTEHHASSGDYVGWLNYIDRSDAWAGVGVGQKLSFGSVALDWRRGGQFQQKLSWAPTTGSNDYNRLLATVEGEWNKRLKFSASAGPDWRKYEDRAVSLEVKDVVPYYELSASYKINADHSLTAAGKRWRWVSSTGKSTYNDSNYTLSVKSNWLPHFSTVVGLQWQESDYVFPVIRRDELLTVSVGAQYNLTKALALTADLAHCRSNNHIHTAAAQGREFERDLLTLGVKWSR